MGDHRPGRTLTWGNMGMFPYDPPVHLNQSAIRSVNNSTAFTTFVNISTFWTGQAFNKDVEGRMFANSLYYWAENTNYSTHSQILQHTGIR